jgi:bifunctional enzyme CysN/CysC
MLIIYLIPFLLVASCVTTKIASNSNSKDYWDDKWQKNAHDQSQANPFAVKVLNYIKNNHKENSINLLDLGSGNGRDALFFANNGAKVHAIDISEQALSALREKNQSIITEPQNFEHLNLPKNSFDVIYAHLSLHYFNNDKTMEIFNVIQSALKPGGLFFVKVKSIKDWQYGEGKQIAPHIFHDGHTRHFFSADKLKTMLNEFNIIEITESNDNYNGKNNAFIEAVVSK